MNAKQLKVWKQRELEKAETLAEQIQPAGPLDIVKMYPEFKLEGAYTTSLEPYAPVWILLPFFDRVVVGVDPHLRTEEHFKAWYGLSVHQLLSLREKGRVEIRVLGPTSVNVVPQYLDTFFSGEFPSTSRDRAFDRALLTQDKYETVRYRFHSLMANVNVSQSIDGFAAHPGRAKRTAETACLQLSALGHEDAVEQFSALLLTDASAAFQWLELCRLFLVGPIHYSLGGIHSVASSVPALKPPTGGESMVFPVELGRILVDALNLVHITSSPDSIRLDDCVEVHPEYATARKALLALAQAVREGLVARPLKEAEDLRQILAEAHESKEWWLRVMRIVAATGVGIASLPFAQLYGLLLGLGFAVISELPGKPFDAGLEKVAGILKPKWNRPYLTLLLDLDISRGMKVDGA